MSKKGIERAIDVAIEERGKGPRGGRVAALAEKLRMSRQVVEKWLRQGYVPASSAIAVSKATGVPLEDLNRDFRGSRTRA